MKSLNSLKEKVQERNETNINVKKTITVSIINYSNF